MIPLIALVACLFFVRALMNVDRQCSPGLSKALWVPTVWFLYCATRPLSEWFQGGLFVDSSGKIGEGSFVDRYFLMVLLVIGLVILQKRRINWQQTMRNNRWLFALFFFMLVSILWSEFPFISLKRWVRTTGTAIMALLVLSEAEPYEAMHAVLRRVIYIVIPFSVLLVKYYPAIGVGFGRWSGEPLYMGASTDKNTLGEVCSLWIFLYIWTLVGRRDKTNAPAVRGQNMCDLIVVLMTLYLMKGPSGYGASSATYSATSIAVLVFGLGVFLALRRFKAHLQNLGGWMTLALFGVGLMALTMDLLDVSPASLVAAALGRQANLTGRGDLIWPVLLPIAWQHPVLGAGYGSSWVKPFPGLTLAINEAHNGYLEVFLELGVVGLILLALAVAMMFRKAKNELAENFGWAAFRMSYLAMFLLHNWTETTLLREVLWNLFVLFAVVYPQEWTGLAGDKASPAEEETAPEEDALAIAGAPNSDLDNGIRAAVQW